MWRLVTGKPRFETSDLYWETVYRSGGNSGAGSHGKLRAFKAEVLNDFVAGNNIKTIIEFGCGDGDQLELAEYSSYVGVDVSPTALEKCREKYRGDPSKRFLHNSELTVEHRADAALSLDVIYHLVEDEVFEDYMRRLFDAATRYVVIYSSNVDKAWVVPHIRHREFTRWIEANRQDFRLSEKISNRYPYEPRDLHNTSFADFYIFERVPVAGDVATT